MHKFYCPQKNISSDSVTIDQLQQVHHIKNVLCLKPAEVTEIFDEHSNLYRCQVKELLKHKVILKIIAKEKAKTVSQVKVTIACAIPKNFKIDDIIDKLTQLGVARIIPLITERVIVKLDDKKKELRNKRWEKIAQSASCQSKRNDFVILEPIQNFSDLIKSSQEYDLKIIPALCAKHRGLRQVLEGANFKNIIVLIGPEGDFSDQEVIAAKACGFIPVSLGHLVLRVETAAAAVASFLQLYYAEH
jgi:16S rRNA (uracil1498-N3)-methyltransferase